LNYEVAFQAADTVPKVKSNKYMAKIVASSPSSGQLHKIISGFFQGRRFQVATISF